MVSTELSGEKVSLDHDTVVNEITRELLDVAQTAITMMFVMEEQYGVNLDNALQEHWTKLERKGYLSR